ncbi:MAG: endopeptidase La [Leptospiraceae bacterium]|nr:endopeptidase La [Leptospiraceae bacterium]
MKKSTTKKRKSTKIKVESIIQEEILPSEVFILPIRIRPIFPGIITPIVVPPGKFSLAVDELYRRDSYLGLLLLKDDKSEKEPIDNTHKIGVIAKVLKKIILPDGGTNILINTIHRFEIDSFKSKEPFLVAKISYPMDHMDKGSQVNLKALMRELLILTKELAQNNPLFTEEMKLTLVNMTDAGKMADFICSILNLEREDYQDVLDTLNVNSRLEKVIIYLKKELQLIDVHKRINEQINNKMDKQQRQHYLREQLKAIQTELGLDSEKSVKKFPELQARLEKANVSSEILEEVKRELNKFNFLDPNSPEYNVSRNYLDMIEALPWEEPSNKEIDLKKSRKILDRDHYRLEEVKDRILEFLAVRKMTSKTNSATILCLVGPPGVGKTSIAKSVAESLGKKFQRISLGGMRDEAEIKGHRRTYIGALPGKILNALRILKEKDPVILLDEIDKLEVGYSGDPASALLEVLDPEQNKTFRDHYLDLPFDLSHVFFIATANTMETIPRVLADRMEVIQISGYLTEEKLVIFKKYLWKKILNRNGLSHGAPSLDQKTITYLIDSYSRESGLRSLEKVTDKLVRKLVHEKATKKRIQKKLESKDLEKYLGIPIFTDDRLTSADKVGTALGLAWTPLGGATLLIEAIFIGEGKELTLTGKLGKTMNESASIALSYIRHSYPNHEKLATNRIHLHVPDGATPKDGPSAGITMATAILSLTLGKPPAKNFAMTGELTLTGEVLPIGGLKEKIVAARRVGIKNIILPKENEPALREVPSYIKKGIKFYPVSHYFEIIKLLFPEESSQS